jgi:hypothetical protein
MKPILAWLLLSAAQAAETVAEIPPQVLADAQKAAQHAAQPTPPSPSPAALQTADEVDILLLTAGTFLAKQQPEKAGERFVAAVEALEKIPRADRRALGPRYVEQRRQLMAMANGLLRDPLVAAALGDEPVVPTPAEQQAALVAPAPPVATTPAAPAPIPAPIPAPVPASANP